MPASSPRVCVPLSCASRLLRRRSKERKLDRAARLDLQLEVALAPYMRRHRRRADLAVLRTTLARRRGARRDGVGGGDALAGGDAEAGVAVADLREDGVVAAVVESRTGGAVDAAVRGLAGARVFVVAAAASAAAAAVAAVSAVVEQ